MKKVVKVLLTAALCLGLSAPVMAAESPSKTMDGKACLTALSVDDITLTGNAIEPAFSPSVTSYRYRVESDIASVRVRWQAPGDTSVLVAGQPVATEGSTIVNLSKASADYDRDFSLNVEIVVKRGETAATYTVTVDRACEKAIRDLFALKEYTDTATGQTIPYWLYMPTGYDPAKKYPLVLALHGSGQRSQPSDMVLKFYRHATAWAADSEKGHNQCIVLAPQCATKDDNENWTSLMKYRHGIANNAFEPGPKLETVYHLLKEVIDKYPVDRARVYMTGLSAGGFGTYALAVRHPELFAAIAPCCGGADPALVGALKGVSIWLFHAADDPRVAVPEYLNPTMAALDAAGIPYKSTIYPAGAVFAPSAHFSWVAMYATTEFRDWLFAQKKQ